MSKWIIQLFTCDPVCSLWPAEGASTDEQETFNVHFMNIQHQIFWSVVSCGSLSCLQLQRCDVSPFFPTILFCRRSQLFAAARFHGVRLSSVVFSPASTYRCWTSGGDAGICCRPSEPCLKPRTPLASLSHSSR